jgi:hypothetical protein
MSKEYEVFFYIKIDTSLNVTADNIEEAVKKARDKVEKKFNAIEEALNKAQPLYIKSKAGCLVNTMDIYSIYRKGL